METCFKGPSIGEVLIRSNQDLPSDLIDLVMITRQGDEKYLTKNMDALVNFSECSSLLDYLQPAEKIEVLINLSHELAHNRPKYMTYSIFKNLSKRNQFLQVLHKNGMLDVIRNTNG